MKTHLWMLVAFGLVVLSACGMNARRSRPEQQATQVSQTSNPEKKSKMSFYDFKMTAIDGTEIDFSQYKGKKVMLVNVASKCGYTPQYEDLQKLHEQMGDEVAILGFPANNFGGQEPGSDEQIQTFCKKNYGVSFQMFSKISVKGNDMHPLYQWLSDPAKNGWNDKAPSWNFCKYLVNEEGELVKFYGSNIKPFDDELVSAIKA